MPMLSGQTKSLHIRPYRPTHVIRCMQGFLPTLLEDVPDMAVKFAVYESMRTIYFQATGKQASQSSLHSVSQRFKACRLKCCLTLVVIT